MPEWSGYLRWAEGFSFYPWTTARRAGHLVGGRHGCCVYIAALLLPGTALCLSTSPDFNYEPPKSRPYLLVAGSPSLRFREAIVPQPDLSTRPPAGAPPHPEDRGSSSTSTLAKANVAAATPAIPAAASPSTPAQKAPPPSDSGPPPTPIIPDDAKPKVRPGGLPTVFPVSGLKA